MRDLPKLIVMLTYSDSTVENAREIFEECKGSKALYWGFKEKPLGEEKTRELRFGEYGNFFFRQFFRQLQGSRNG